MDPQAQKHKSSPSHLLLILPSCCVSQIRTGLGLNRDFCSLLGFFCSFPPTSPTLIPTESDDRGEQTLKGRLAASPWGYRERRKRGLGTDMGTEPE